MRNVLKAELPAELSLGAARLAVGLIQGLGLYFLSLANDAKLWPATDGPLFAAFLVATLFAPLVLLGGIGHLRRVTLVIWFSVAAAVAAGVAAYAVANALPAWEGMPPTIVPDLPVFPAIAAFLFIGHHLIVPADAERKWLAPYEAYFDVGWLDAAQLALALVFIGVLWMLLHIGGALFLLIGIKGFEETLTKSWFWIPVTAIGFALGVHLSDVRVGLTRGLRTIGLFLLSWLAPVMAVIAVAFLASLPFTGLAQLWKAKIATSVLLSSIAALVVLANAVYKDGGPEARAALALRWTARIIALALVPLAAVAAYGLWLRVGEHGLTPPRIIAAACMVPALCYAIGYAVAALTPGRWMGRLEGANVFTAFVILGLILALFTPIADPARLSVNDQVARLKAGTTPADKFDFHFLRFGAGKIGLAALEVLAKARSGPNAILIARLANEARTQANSYEPAPQPQQDAVFPKGATIPDSLRDQLIKQEHGCVPGCEIFPVALGLDGGVQYVVRLAGPYSYASPVVYGWSPSARSWSKLGQIEGTICAPAWADLHAGRVTPSPTAPPSNDLLAGGQRLVVSPVTHYDACPRPASPSAPVSGGQTAPAPNGSAAAR